MPVGFGCFYAFIVFAFNFEDSFISEENKPVAFLAVILAISGLIIYIFIGKKLYKSYKFIPKILGVILISAFLSLPAIQIVTNIYDSNRNYYAKNHEDKYITDLQFQFAKEINTLEVDLKKSNYETLYYRDKRIYLSKINDQKLTIEEIDKVISILPKANVQISITIYYHNYNDSSQGRFHLLLNQDKTPTTVCDSRDSDDYELFCSKYVMEAYSKKIIKRKES
ncbi:MAG: hypothetical protein P0Y55_08615 [Candidatus Cohnella colombiensis]|uniref:Uncharacterized protein n=1 Tax=Candidatus Cohnella colombiensis TaxID=3121368 RepID=A0AA95JH59_9BACL|nr:MAG: hypothetical protein P0Y55_08615 [Cohnella sp.]